MHRLHNVERLEVIMKLEMRARVEQSLLGTGVCDMSWSDHCTSSCREERD